MKKGEMQSVNFTPTDKQQEILEACDLENDYPLVLVSAGRQVGKTEIALRIASEWILNNKGYRVAFFLLNK